MNYIREVKKLKRMYSKLVCFLTITALIISCAKKHTILDKTESSISRSYQNAEDDTMLLQRMIDNGGVVKLNRDYFITSPIQITKSI